MSTTHGTSAVTPNPNAAGAYVGQQAVDLLASSDPNLHGKAVPLMSTLRGDNPDAVASETTVAAIVTALAGALKVNAQRGSKVLTTPAIGNTATLALAANAARKEAVLTNPASNTTSIKIGPAGVTANSYMWELQPGAAWLDDLSNDAWYAISPSGNQQLNVTETT